MIEEPKYPPKGLLLRKLNFYQLFSLQCFRFQFVNLFSAIRLISGREADLVEVKLDGRWGGICDDGFSFNEANVACRQLGFELGAEQVRLTYYPWQLSRGVSVFQFDLPLNYKL